MLTIDRLGAGYASIQILQQLSFDIHEKEIVSLLGGNGAGKTTTVKSLSGLIPIESGRITLTGATSLSARSRTGCGRSGSGTGGPRKCFLLCLCWRISSLGPICRIPKAAGGSPGVGHGNVSDPERSPKSGSRHDVRRRTANVGTGQGLDVPAKTSDSGRTFPWPGTPGGKGDIRDHLQHPQRRSNDFAGLNKMYPKHWLSRTARSFWKTGVSQSAVRDANCLNDDRIQRVYLGMENCCNE